MAAEFEPTKIDIIRIRVWSGPEDSVMEYFKLPNDVIQSLVVFVTSGKLSADIRGGLQEAMQESPLWRGKSVDDKLPDELRKNLAGRFVQSNGRRVAPLFTLDLDVISY